MLHCETESIPNIIYTWLYPPFPSVSVDSACYTCFPKMLSCCLGCFLFFHECDGFSFREKPRLQKNMLLTVAVQMFRFVYESRTLVSRGKQHSFLMVLTETNIYFSKQSQNMWVLGLDMSLPKALKFICCRPCKKTELGSMELCRMEQSRNWWKMIFLSFISKWRTALFLEIKLSEHK